MQQISRMLTYSLQDILNVELIRAFLEYCYKLVQGFRVTCLFTGPYNTKGYYTITNVFFFSENIQRSV